MPETNLRSLSLQQFIIPIKGKIRDIKGMNVGYFVTTRRFSLPFVTNSRTALESMSFALKLLLFTYRNRRK